MNIWENLEINFIFILFIFYWGIIALQCLVNFGCTTKWISCVHAYIHSFPSLPPTASPHPTPPGHHRTASWAPGAVERFPTSCLLCACSVCMPTLHSQSSRPSPCPAVSTCLLSTSASLFLPSKWVHRYHFPRFCIYVFKYGVCFSLSDLLHSATDSRSIHITANHPVSKGTTLGHL